jgi:hypothetical protein
MALLELYDGGFDACIDWGQRASRPQALRRR